MSDIFIKIAAGSICNLSPYTPGKPISELQRELNIDKIVKLASNENPLGPSPKAMAAIKTILSDSARYPDGNAFELKEALSEHINIPTSSITLGNGSDSIFTLLGQVFVKPGETVIASQYAFAAYKIAAATMGANFIETPARNWGYDLQAIEKAIDADTRLIFIANPNNPTGTWLDENQLQKFLGQISPDILVVLDEAYYEFMQQDPGYPDTLKLQQQFPNVIITRTFSKVYGLAALRVGYSITHPTIADLLNRVRLPFNVSTCGQMAAIAALSDNQHLQKTLDINSQGKAQLTSAMDKLKIDYLPVNGNFITINVDTEGNKIFKDLLTEGIIVRPLANYAMDSFLRISIGTAEENDMLIHGLQKVLCK